MDDLELLRDYAASQSEQAFATIVGRHVDLFRVGLVRSLVGYSGECGTGCSGRFRNRCSHVVGGGRLNFNLGIFGTYGLDQSEINAAVGACAVTDATTIERMVGGAPGQ